MVGGEDLHLAVARREMHVDRHVQHHVGGLGAEVVAAPDHVAQIVVHVLVGGELGDLRLQAEALGECAGKGDVDALAGCRPGREVGVARYPQGARLLELQLGRGRPHRAD